MTTVIKTKNSTTTTTAPSSLAQGELAVNITDKKIWIGNASTTPVLIGDYTGSIVGGSNTQVQYNSNGAFAGSANMTFSGTALTLANDASISGLTVGKGGGAVSTNTAVGANSLAANTTGSLNTALGYGALANNTDNSANTAIGYLALTAQGAGTYQNTAVGAQAMYTNTTGVNNTAVGRGAMTLNTTGSNNASLGFQALYSNTTASNNTAVGYQAGYSNTTGAASVYFGGQAGYTNSTGKYQTFIGYTAGYSATADNSTFVGFQAGYSTTGAGNCFIGAYNPTAGTGSGQSVTTGTKNTIVGSYNGNQGGLDIRTASNYIVLSDGDGNPRGVFDGSGNFLVGATSNTIGSDNGLVALKRAASGYSMILGSAQTGSISYMIKFTYDNTTGTGQISTTNTTVTYATSSDYRLKEEVAPMTGALSKVAQLKPVTYKWKTDGSNGQGFIAHELAEVFPEAVVGEKDAVKEVTKEDGTTETVPEYQGIDTSFLVATLTAAIQELKAEVDALKAAK